MTDHRADSDDSAPTPGPLATMAWVANRLAIDGRLARVVTRPHPLLVTIRKDALVVLLAPAAVWDHARELLRPFAASFAEGQAMLIFLGRPSEPDLDQAMNRGLGAIAPEQPGPDELFVAVHNCFELLDARSRAESRGKWLNRYRYELGELIEIAKAITTEREA